MDELDVNKWVGDTTLVLWGFGLLSFVKEQERMGVGNPGNWCYLRKDDQKGLDVLVFTILMCLGAD